ncbi:13015_t:CDS:2, partial [Ambispora leptoticha]
MSLSAECIQNIFLFLYEDTADLFSCLLVNRFWCQNSVALLWRRPWIPGHSRNQESASKLIQIYVSCLPEEAKKNLIKNGINFRTPSTPLAFDYASFLRDLDYDQIESEEETEEETERKTKLVANELCKLFMSKCATFFSLCLATRADQVDYPFLPSFPNTGNYLSKLREFTCQGDEKAELFIALSQVCKDIHRISVSGTSYSIWTPNYEADTLSLASLIKAQTRLKSLCLYGYQGFLANILNALEYQRHSLESLELRYTDIKSESDCNSLETLSQCGNLTSLKLHNCSIPPNEKLMHLTKFSRLEEFDYCNEWNPFFALPPNNFWATMFRNTTKTLRRLSLWWIRADQNDGAQIIEYIAENCKNVTYLHLPVLWASEVFRILDS